MEISDLIKSARIEKGSTQQQLADVVFVTYATDNFEMGIGKKCSWPSLSYIAIPVFGHQG